MIERGFPALIKRLGLRGAMPRLRLSDTVVATVQLDDLKREQTLGGSLVGTALGYGYFTQGVLTNSPANTIHVDTEGLEAGQYEGWAWYHTEVNSTAFDLQIRNVANDANVQLPARVSFQANDSSALPVYVNITADNQRVRILNITAIGVGLNTQVCLFLRRS